MGKSWRCMNFKKVIPALILFFVFNAINAQQLYPKDSILLSEVKKIEFDAEGNLYVLQGKKFYKYFKEDNKNPLVYTANKEIIDFSIQTKFNLFLFSLNSVIILSQQLTSLEEEIFVDLKPLAANQQKMLFLFDPFSRTLSKMDLLTRQIVSSAKLDKELQSAHYFGNHLYLVFTDNIAVYDDFLYKVDEVNKIADDLVNDINQVYMLKKNNLISLNGTKTINTPIEGMVVALGPRSLAVATAEKIYIYDYKK